MKKIVLLFALALAACYVSPASADIYDNDAVTAELPHDADKLHLTLFVDGHTDRQLVEWFQTDSRLVEFRARTHFHVIDVRSPIFREHYSKTVPRWPLVRVQTQDAYVANIEKFDYASDRNKLVVALGKHIRCFFGRRQVSPEVRRLPPVESTQDPLPAVEPKASEPVKQDEPRRGRGLLYSILAIAGSLAAVGVCYYDEHYA